MATPPKTNAEAFQHILTLTTKAKLAEHLGVTRQLTSRWEEIPSKYADEVAEMLDLPIGHVVPELVHKIRDCGKDFSDDLIRELIYIFHER